MIKNIRLVITFALIVPTFILSIIPYSIVLLLKLCKATKLANALAAVSFKTIIYLCVLFAGAKVTVIGSEKIPPKGTNLCYVGNHQSMLDICLPIYARGRVGGFVGKIEVKKIPVVSNWFTLMGGVYLDRKSPRASIKAILDASNNVKNGIPMIIFPEGTRSKDGSVATFKPGAFKLGTKVGAVIQPVVIANSRKAVETRTSLLTQRIYVKYLDPIDSSKLSAEELIELPQKVEDLIRAEVEYYQNVKTK